jgi:hypothetical protein
MAIPRRVYNDSHREISMNPREQRIMAAIFAAAAVYLFEWAALLLFGIGGVIYWILRNRT